MVEIFEGMNTGDLRAYLAGVDPSSEHLAVLDHARSFFDKGEIDATRLLVTWLIDKRPDFSPAYILMASLLLKDNRLNEAIAFIDQSKLVNFNEHQQQLLKYIKAKCLYENGEIKESANLVFNDFYDAENKPLWFHVLECDLLYNSGMYKELLRFLENKIKQFKGNEYFMRQRVNALIRVGNTDVAYDEIKSLLTEDEVNPGLLFQKGKIEYQRQEYNLAKKSFLQMLDTDSRFSGHLWLSKIYHLKGKKKKLSKHLDQAIELAETENQKLSCLHLLATIGEYDKANSLSDELIISKPENALILRNIAQYKLKQAKYDEAKSLLAKALKLSNDPGIHFDLAKIASEKKQYEKAEKILVLHNLMDDPKLAYHARKEYCQIPFRQSRYIQSLQRYKDFAVFFPDDFDIKVNVVENYIRLSEFDKAIDLLEKAISKDNKNIRARQTLIDCYYKNQNYYKAIQLLRTYFSEFEEDVHTIYLMAECLREVGKFEESENLLNRALEKYPESFSLKLSLGRLYRRLSSEFFFEKSRYNQMALDLHKGIQTSETYQERILSNEIINDLIHLNKYSEALGVIENQLQLHPESVELFEKKIQVFSKMGLHKEAVAFIEELQPNIQADAKISTLRAEELFYLDSWEDCLYEVQSVIDNYNIPEVYTIKAKLLLRQGKFEDAIYTIQELMELSVHSAFVDNEIIDFAFTHGRIYLSLIQKLNNSYRLDNDTLTRILPSFIEEEDEISYLKFNSHIVLSHAFLKDGAAGISDILFFNDENEWQSLSSIVHESIYDNDGNLYSFIISTSKIKLPSAIVNDVSFYSIFALPTDGTIVSDAKHPFKDWTFTTNIVETGLGDQLHYIRTAALIAESLGMRFEGFLESQLSIIRDRVTDSPDLYKDLGFASLEIKDADYDLIKVPLTLNTRLVPAFYQWPSFRKFMKYIESLVLDAVEESSSESKRNKLIYLSVDDHNFSRLFARMYYPIHEPSSITIRILREQFYRKQYMRNWERGSALSQGLTVLLQCRLGDVANIPFEYNGEKVWVVPFSGELMKDNISNKHHMRYSNLEKVKKIGQCIKNEFGEAIQLKLITDGYDYGIDYLKEYQQILIDELGTSNSELDELKHKLATNFHEEFSFVDEIVYGEDYDKLIHSIDLVTTSNVLISTNGQFTNEFKMSFSLDEENYLIVKKLYSNLRVSRSIHSTEMFWELDGIDEDKMLQRIMHYIQSRL